MSHSGKTPVESVDSARSALRSIPSVERILSSASFAPLVARFGREQTKTAVVAHLAGLRERGHAYDETAALLAVAAGAADATGSPLRRVVNATGVLIHTNLGRSPIDSAIWDEAGAIAARYVNLEFDLEEGTRGARDGHLTALCRTLFGCEEALLANNNAAGTLLLLAASAAGREVIVSRGELVEIGGSFRVPDVIQQGGAKLREVGTTNRTRARDYEEAVGSETAAILRVHRSNFEIVGFTETPSVEELVASARRSGVPLFYDEGAGRAIDLETYGFARGETIRELIAAGVDVVTCSTDKLLGASQGGLILGRAEFIAKCRRHPLMRALRAGKESYALIAATLRAFVTGRHEERISLYRMLATPLGELRARAEAMAAGTDCRIVESRVALGGGTTPTETIASIAIELPGDPEGNYARLLRNDPPIAGRIVDDRCTLEVRSLDEHDRAVVAKALREG